MSLRLPLAIAAILLASGSTTLHARGHQSAFFLIEGDRLVQRHAYHRERHREPVCGMRTTRGDACVGHGGMLVWH